MKLLLLIFIFTSQIINVLWAENYTPSFTNLPAVQMRCLPHNPIISFHFFWLPQLSNNPEKQAETLQAAKQQNITIGYEKFGPFDEDQGTLSLMCNTIGKQFKIKFTYTNFPHLRLGDGQPNLLAYGQCDDLSRLDIKGMTLNEKLLNSKISASLDSCYHTPQLSSLTLNVEDRTIQICVVLKPSDNPATPALSCATTHIKD